MHESILSNITGYCGMNTLFSTNLHLFSVLGSLTAKVLVFPFKDKDIKVTHLASIGREA